MLIPATEVEESPGCRQAGKDIPLLHFFSFKFFTTSKADMPLLKPFYSFKSLFDKHDKSQLPFHLHKVTLINFLCWGYQMSESCLLFGRDTTSYHRQCFLLFLAFVKTSSSRYFLPGEDLALLQSHFHTADVTLPQMWYFHNCRTITAFFLTWPLTFLHLSPSHSNNSLKI